MYICLCLFKYTIFIAVSFLFYLFYHSKFLKNLIIITKVKAMRSKKDLEKSALTHEEELERQVSNLKKALEYSELRNQGLMKIIEISSKEYGEDLLKKAGAKQ